MAFTNVGPLRYLSQGQSSYWEYWYGDDHGTQMATADVKAPNPGSWHVADSQRKRKNNDGTATYSVTIVNQGPGPAFHNLQGGGVS
jgi:hypothetical protein